MIRVLGCLLLLALTTADECPHTLDVVCGSDGVLYYNECTLKAWTKDKDVQAVAWEDCQVDCDLPRACTLEYIPHCGSDGNIYGNRCGFLWGSCGQPAPLKKEPIANCVDKKCPDNCSADDEDCKGKVAECRKPWEGYIGTFVDL